MSSSPRSPRRFYRSVESSLMCCVLVRKFVIRREVQPKKEGAKPYTKVRYLPQWRASAMHTNSNKRHQRSSVSSPHSASSTSATDKRSSAAERKPPRTLPYVDPIDLSMAILDANWEQLLPKARILYIGWCGKPPPSTGKKTLSLLVAFADPRDVNAVLRNRLYLRNRPLNVELYDPACRLV